MAEASDSEAAPLIQTIDLDRVSAARAGNPPGGATAGPTYITI